MPFIDRRPRGPGRFLQWKLRLMAVGAVLLLVGMARDLDLLVILSIVGSSRVDLQACKLEYSIVSPK